MVAAAEYQHDNFFIKLRLPEGSKTVHAEKHHYETLFRQSRVQKPYNMHFYYGPMSEDLLNADLLLTLSSTAAVEAIASDVPVGIISDFGMWENYGVAHFCGSGMLGSIGSLVAGNVRKPHREWLDLHGFDEQSNRVEAFLMIDNLIRRQRELGHALPVTEPFYIAKNLPYEFSEFARPEALKQRQKGNVIVDEFPELVPPELPLAQKKMRRKVAPPKYPPAVMRIVRTLKPFTPPILIGPSKALLRKVLEGRGPLEVLLEEDGGPLHQKTLVPGGSKAVAVRPSLCPSMR